MKNTILLFLLFFFIGIFPLRGDNGSNFFSQYNYTYLDANVGLPHNFVDDILKDFRGYIWIATHNGLSRYDGYSFITFTTVTDPISLKNNNVHKICEDNFGRLWVGSEGGIDIIDLTQYCNADFDIQNNSILEKMMNSNISNIYKDNKGDLWISSENTLFCIELNSKGDLADYYYLENNYSKKPVLAVIDVGWAVCAGVNNSVVRIDKRVNNMLNVNPLSKLVDTFFDDWTIHCMELDGENLWIGTNRGLFQYDHFNQKLHIYKSSSKYKPGMLSQNHITDIKLNETGVLFISTLKGLNIYNREKDNFSFILESDENNLSTLNCNFINCLFTDRNCIWVGTEIGGVNLLTKGRLVTQNWTHNRTDVGSLSPNAVNSICEDNDGNLWVGTVEGGLNLKRKGQNTFEHFVSDSKDVATISHNSVCELLLDTDNYLWVCTWGGGISKLNLNSLNNRKFKRYKDKPEGVELNFVASACEDTINRGIWFGTTEGLHFFDKEKEEFIKIKFSQSKNYFETIGTLLIDKQNRLWVGTSQGLFIVNLFSFARSRIHFDYVYIKHKLSDPSYPVADKVNCVVQDSEGIIWIGTDGEGLYRLISNESSAYQFQNYTVKDGLPDNNIIGIVEDGMGALWFSTNKGISQLYKERMIFSNFTKYDGLLTNQFYWNAYYYSHTQDLIYFGNTKGLVAIQPNIPKENYRFVEVSLTELKILGQLVYPGNGKYLEEEISHATHIFLHERDRVINLNFSVKKYDYINQVRYAYKLKGYDEKWTETNIGENSVVYTSLPAGNYVFQVKATNNKGYWSDEITEIDIHVKSYFYKAKWFISLLIALLLISIYLFYLRKTKKYRQQQEVLKKTVQQRTKELVEQNERLIEVSRKLANATEEKMSFFTYVAHEFRTPVTLIDGPLEKAIKQSTEPEIKENLLIAKRNSEFLVSLVNELMDFQKLDANKVQMEKKSENFQSFMEYVLMPFYAFARDKGIELKTFYRLSTPYIILDYNLMRKVIINLVSNAIKATPLRGTICVYVASLTLTEGVKQLYINVRDTGVGIPEEDLEKIFNQFYQVSVHAQNTDTWKNSTGIGLSSCKKIIDLHQGCIKAYNNKNKGASFRILLPLIEGKQMVEYFNSNDSEKIKSTKQDTSSSGKETILVVDDNPDMRAYIKSLLSSIYNVLEAQDGAEALSIIQGRSIDLILSDLMMPIMDGLELSKQVKSNIVTSHIPFIILTSLVSEDQKKISYEIGVDEYLCKPFDEEMLLLRIRNILDMRKKYKAQFSISMDSKDLNIGVQSKDELFMNKAIELMKTNYENSDYDLNSFVRDLGYSKTLVNKKLQDLVGQSIGQFMRNYRLSVAREILMNVSGKDDINISEVAYRVGFNDPKYFTRCFKEYAGVLPSELLSQK